MFIALLIEKLGVSPRVALETALEPQYYLIHEGVQISQFRKHFSTAILVRGIEWYSWFLSRSFIRRDMTFSRESRSNKPQLDQTHILI